MVNVFETIDKTGRKIRLTKERWTHITSPQHPHAYMTNYLEEIKHALVRPDIIRTSIYDENKVNYYFFLKEKKKYIKVIVRYLNGEGFVITTYMVTASSK